MKTSSSDKESSNATGVSWERIPLRILRERWSGERLSESDKVTARPARRH